MSETTPTPNAMPGANPPAPQGNPKTEPAPEAKATPAETPAETGISSEEKAELQRLRDIHKDEQKYRREATKNFEDAERWRQLQQQVGGPEAKDFDPQAAFNDLLQRVETSERERVKAEVARTENVPPKYIQGKTEEEMRASAQEYLADQQAAIEAALKGRAPAAVPASEVTSNGKVAGPNQITSLAELKTMTPQEINTARREGRLESLMGKH